MKTDLRVAPLRTTTDQIARKASPSLKRPMCCERPLSESMNAWKTLSSRTSGELVEAQALTGPEQAKFVVYDGVGAPVVTDGPFPEGKELLAGYRMIDVESLERAIEIAAEASAAPGPGGKPIKTVIEVREVMGAPMPEQ